MNERLHDMTQTGMLCIAKEKELKGLQLEIFLSCNYWGRHGHGRMVVRFITTYANSAYHH
jgi:hypothetical protein